MATLRVCIAHVKRIFEFNHLFLFVGVGVGSKGLFV